jgi:hypothetical protein
VEIKIFIQNPNNRIRNLEDEKERQHNLEDEKERQHNLEDEKERQHNLEDGIKIIHIIYTFEDLKWVTMLF